MAELAGRPARPLLEVRGVTLQDKSRDQLVTPTYCADFEYLRSDRFVLLGPSGCGKFGARAAQEKAREAINVGGLIVENVIFRTVGARSVRCWGMQS